MAYQCRCGNSQRFLEVFDVAIDVVDGEGHFVEMKDRNVFFYMCCECDREISYEDFWRGAAHASANAKS
jgi:hypothetical protein